MSQPDRTVLAETATQVLAHVNLLAGEHSIPAHPKEDAFWKSMQDAIRTAFLAHAEAYGALHS